MSLTFNTMVQMSLTFNTVDQTSLTFNLVEIYKTMLVHKYIQLQLSFNMQIIIVDGTLIFGPLLNFLLKSTLWELRCGFKSHNVLQIVLCSPVREKASNKASSFAGNFNIIREQK